MTEIKLFCFSQKKKTAWFRSNSQVTRRLVKLLLSFFILLFSCVCCSQLHCSNVEENCCSIHIVCLVWPTWDATVLYLMLSFMLIQTKLFFCGVDIVANTSFTEQGIPYLPTWMQKSPRIVPGLDSAGLVSPSITLPVLTTFKPSQTCKNKMLRHFVSLFGWIWIIRFHPPRKHQWGKKQCISNQWFVISFFTMATTGPERI